MIELHVTCTSKGYSPRDDWSRFHEFTRRFDSMAEARGWLAETYGKAKRVPMYCDQKDGPPKKTGYVIGFRASDWSHPVQRWLQQDWIEFRESKSLELANR